MLVQISIAKTIWLYEHTRLGVEGKLSLKVFVEFIAIKNHLFLAQWQTLQSLISEVEDLILPPPPPPRKKG